MGFDAYWDERAGSYPDDTVYTVGKHVLDAEATALVEAVSGGDAVELGCGTGTFTRLYAPKCRSVIATDYAEHMVQTAARELADLPNVTVRVADATATGLPCESADVVVAMNLIHILPEPAALVAEAHRLLREGGVIVLSSYSNEGLSLWSTAAMGLRALRRFGIGLLRQRAHLTQAALETLVAEAGFGDVEGRLLLGGEANAMFVRAVRR